MKKIVLALFCLAIMAINNGFSCNTHDEQVSSGSSGAAVGQVTAAGVTMKWSVVGTDLSVTLSAQTAGWVAVGFNPTNRHQGANIIIGYVSGGVAFIEDNFGNGPTTHVTDGIQNVTEKTGTEAGGITEISFKIPLNSGDAQDQPLVVGTNCTIILAYGPADNFTTQHTSMGTALIRIQ
ncbi:MAG: DOMON domain-containing protein [Planctomycetes bacterium]|nr:DOMON domain-containing protein [Planctomycetota bacterium]